MNGSGARIAGVLMGIALLITGIVRHEPAALLIRAITICLECMGIG